MTMTTHGVRLGELQNRIVAIDRDIKTLDGQYAELAGAFDVGDRAALGKAAAIETQINQLRRERTLTIAAQQKVAEQQQQEQAESEQEAKRQRLVEAKKHADSIMALNVRIDEALRLLVNLFAQRSNALRALSSTGIVDATHINKLLGKPTGTRAACAAGIHQFIAMETVAPQSHQPMASANSILIDIGQGADPHPRRRLNGA